jgi:hypothetical protein
VGLFVAVIEVLYAALTVPEGNDVLETTGGEIDCAVKVTEFMLRSSDRR